MCVCICTLKRLNVKRSYRRHFAVLGTYCSVAEVNLVANDDKRKVLGIAWTSLDEKFISPALKCLECVGNGDVVDQDAAVGTAVERNAEALEPFLSCRVPDLQCFTVL